MPKPIPRTIGVPPDVLAELRLQYRQRRMADHVLHQLNATQIQYIYEIHSANDDSDPDVDLFLDTIDAYLNALYVLPE